MSLPALARALAEAAAYLGGTPAGPVPVERTRRSPWVWVSPQALRSGLDAHSLAAEVIRRDLGVAVAARSDGWIELSLTSHFLSAALIEQAPTAGMPPARLPPSGPSAASSAPGWSPASPGGGVWFSEAVARFEAARTAGGAPALDHSITARRTLANPVFVVLLAHARAVRSAAAYAAIRDRGLVQGQLQAGAFRQLIDPLDTALVTEILDAPRRLAAGAAAPHKVATMLLAVATAYLAWEECVDIMVRRAGQPTTATHLARQAVSHAGLGVLERGMGRLGITPTGRM